jgi:hypothetical protein
MNKKNHMIDHNYSGLKPNYDQPPIQSEQNDDMIKQQIASPLTSDELQKLFPFPIRIIRYGLLPSFQNLDQILDPYGAAIILFETEVLNGNPNQMKIKNPKKSAPIYSGHYVALCRSVDDDNNPSINFFDSYGIIPDDEKKYIDKEFQSIIGTSYNYLSQLLLHANNNYDEVIEYNQIRFQKMDKNVSTCGRYCAIRVLLKEFPLDQFQEFMKRLKNRYDRSYDEIVVILTQPVLDGEISAKELQGLLRDMVMSI